MGAIAEKYDEDWANFKFGIYEHYRGGRYTALMIVQHHDTRRPMVVYVSHERGSINCRPLRGWSGTLHAEDDPKRLEDPECHDPDGWLDEVDVPNGDGTDAARLPRFKYIGPSKS